jgi:hypothetical protein
MKPRKTRSILAALALACAVFAAAPPAFAQKAFLEKILGDKTAEEKKKNEYLIHDDASFAENTHSLHMRPYNNAALEFDMRLPKNWTSEDMTQNQTLNTDKTIIGDITRMESEMIGVQRVNLTISLQTVNRDISAKNWLKNYILTNGYALQEEVREESPRAAKAYYTSISNQSDLFTYIAVRITGNIVFISRFEAPLGLRDYIGFLQKKMIDTLQLTYPREDSVELQKTFTLVDAFKFNYPVSWQPVDPDFKDMSRLSVQLQIKNPSGVLDGFIHLFAVRRTGNRSLTKEVEALKKHFSDYMGINVTSLAYSSKPEQVHSRFLFSRYEVYKASYKKEGHVDPEVRLLTLGDKDWYIFIYLISPREQENLPNWAHNVRTLEMIMSSIR